ncbi:hypothetical protein BKA93DRAFT_807056 [Sparassis latifolia]
MIIAARFVHRCLFLGSSDNIHAFISASTPTILNYLPNEHRMNLAIVSAGQWESLAESFVREFQPQK